jgi:hypothetical protein
MTGRCPIVCNDRSISSTRIRMSLSSRLCPTLSMSGVTRRRRSTISGGRWLFLIFPHEPGCAISSSRATACARRPAMIRREAYDAVGFYDRRLTNLQDFDMWIRMLLAGHSIHVMPIETTAFRISDCSANMSASRHDTMLRHHFELSRILRRYLELDGGDFESLFGGEATDTVGLPVSRRLAHLALRQGGPSHKLFALEALHETASSHADFDFLRETAGANDLFGIELAQRLSKEKEHSRQLEQGVISTNEALRKATSQLDRTVLSRAKRALRKLRRAAPV